MKRWPHSTRHWGASGQIRIGAFYALIMAPTGAVKANAPAGADRGRTVATGHASPQKTSQPVPLFQFVARGHPPGGDDVRAVPAVVAER